MANIYYVELKGIKDNKNCWRAMGVYHTLKDALEHYNFWKSGCHKRIRKKKVKFEWTIIREKKY